MDTSRIPRMLILVLSCILQYEINAESQCPKAEHKECNREIEHFQDRIHVNSTRYKINFLCDTKTEGGGWIIFYTRVKKDTRFDKTWNAYKVGFGKICGDYWLGNEHIHRITSDGHYELRIDLVLRNRPYYSLYSNFFIENEGHGYRLHYKSFIAGNISDILKIHDGQRFSTPDRDNDLAGDKHCARVLQSGWWYSKCNKVDFFGLFPRNPMGYGEVWEGLTKDHLSLNYVEMKIREVK